MHLSVYRTCFANTLDCLCCAHVLSFEQNNTFTFILMMDCKKLQYIFRAAKGWCISQRQVCGTGKCVYFVCPLYVDAASYFNDRKQQLQNISAFVHAVLDGLTGRKINFLKLFPVVTGTLTLHDLVDALQDCVRQCTAKGLTEQQVRDVVLVLSSQLMVTTRLVF